jgi:hypothetical protein
MKKGIVLLSLFVFLSVSLVASLMLNSGNLSAQVQQKALQQKRVLPALKTSVTSVTPQKAVITQGGDAVVVEAKGTNLNIINSAQVLRAGNAVTEIEVTLDKSLLPTTLKVSLKATATAPFANDYQLAVFDAGNKKLLDVPTTILAIEVVAAVRKAAVAMKTTTALKTTEPVQLGFDRGKIDNFLKVLQGAQSLKEAQTAFNQAKFSKDEATGLQRQIESSPTLKAKLDGLYNQEMAAAKIEMDKMKAVEAQQMKIAEAQLNKELVTAQQASFSRLTKQRVALLLDPEVRCRADAPSIGEVSEVMPGEQFVIQGMGLGKDPGTVDVMVGGFVFPAVINSWNSCQVLAQLSANIKGVRPDNQAAVSLKTSTGREVRHFTKFTPLMEEKYYGERDSCAGWFTGRSTTYTYWDRVLKNDWYVKTTWLHHWGEGHAEITQAPPENMPHFSTFTLVHAGVAAFGICSFCCYQIIAGPKGTSPD